MEVISLDTIKGAEYNPRFLSDQAFDNLKDSLRSLGIVKPIIVRRENMTIVAGHQRTKAMRSLGIKETPAIILNNISLQEEVLFNQLHNGSDYEYENDQPFVRINGIVLKAGEFIEVEPKNVEIVKMQGNIVKAESLQKMILKYGPFGSCIADEFGNVIISSVYASVCKLTGKKLLVRVIENNLRETAISFFSLNYGVFNYDNLPKKTYMQSLAQMKRSVHLSTEKKEALNKLNKSTLYEQRVIPYLKYNKGLRVLDFGAGRKSYVSLLKQQGYDIHGLEFYFREGDNNSISTGIVERDIDTIIRSIKEHGRYDVVVCDSVLNSVDSLEAEFGVLSTLSALCKKDGVVFWSGRPYEATKRLIDRTTIKASHRNEVRFFDNNYFSATIRYGQWYYQKFHSKEQVKELSSKIYGDSYSYFNEGTAFHVVARNQRCLDQKELDRGVKFEFSLPLPQGKRYERAADILNALMICDNQFKD